MGEKLSMITARAYYEAGVKAAEQAFAPVKASQPVAPKPQTAGQVGMAKAQSTSLSLSPPAPPAPPKPAISFKPPPLQMPPSPVTNTQQMMSARQTDVTQQGAAKAANFNMEMIPPPRPRPGEVEPNNRDVSPGTNFQEPRNPNRIGSAFDGLREQRNHDVINAGNEASIGSVTT
jgi:hypothetical protein